MPVTYTIIFDVVPEKKARFMELLAGILDVMRHEPMFHQAVLHRDPENENRMMLYETWEDHGDVLAVQLARPYRVAWHEALPGLLAAPRGIAMWEPVRADRRGG
ncbi:putative quinol monooxygenase [Arenibaculum sp.]|uniref:putative quinol monooxygenase n=1 Tax=Arenibaculum sp. TaxID=2865862 RepID=UPI002E143296|nr:putative quinol monooxygenase [Arenibaculum sp.]